MTLDIQIFNFLNNFAGQSRFLDGTIVFFASYSAYILIAGFLFLLVFSQRSRVEKFKIVLITVASGFIARFGVVELIRFFYHRPRPFVDLSVNQLLSSNEWSFPSGHAAFFFAMSTSIYLLYSKKWGIVFFVVSIFMTLGRVAAGIHYPSDILGGAIIGIIVAHIVFYAYRNLVGKTISTH